MAEEKQEFDRMIIALNVSNRLACTIQQVINRDKFSRRVYAFYETACTVSPSLTVRIGTHHNTANKADVQVMHKYDLQMMLDMRSDAEEYVRQKTAAMLRDVFQQAEVTP